MKRLELNPTLALKPDAIVQFVQSDDQTSSAHVHLAEVARIQKRAVAESHES